jgi:uncharacterized protein YigA (DUF484 family)
MDESESLRARVSELESQLETFLAEHEENVRLHFRNKELEAKLAAAREALKTIASEHKPRYETEEYWVAVIELRAAISKALAKQARQTRGG